MINIIIDKNQEQNKKFQCLVPSNFFVKFGKYDWAILWITDWPSLIDCFGDLLKTIDASIYESWSLIESTFLIFKQ